jgi:hypothetical protein
MKWLTRKKNLITNLKRMKTVVNIGTGASANLRTIIPKVEKNQTNTFMKKEIKGNR